MTGDGGSGELVGPDEVSGGPGELEPTGGSSGLEPTGGPSELDLVAAALRADLSDIDAFVEGLAVRLEDALPGMVAVTRSKRGFRGPKFVDAIVVDAAQERLELQRAGGGVVARRAKLSGGIVLKRETLELDAWLARLSEVLSGQAQRNERTRQALERLLLN